ncbi:MAG: indole-3-glycerol phosphate synthase TrpC [Chloroflexota bacterium]|nr:indole-3-glycerol phosphate synthase TrpC [Chloroflexota bacterium]
MILDEIVADVRAALERRKADCPQRRLEERVEGMAPPLDLQAFLRRPGVSIIAEVKRASPSRGALNMGLDPAQLAVTYASAGAQAISVLTEERHFRGQLADLANVRRTLDSSDMARPILRKDFIVDPYQLLEARAWGADAVLLIAAVLEAEMLEALMHWALSLGLTPLVEVHNEVELEAVLPLEPPVIGVNNRNLEDFTVDLATTEKLVPLIQGSSLIVSESGIHEADQMRRLAALGVDAALIGEALVTAADPAAKIRALREAGR